MMQHQPKRIVNPATWSAVLLLAIAIVVALAFAEGPTIAGSLRPLNQVSTLAPAAVEPRLSGTFKAPRQTRSTIRSTTSLHLTRHTPHPGEPFVRQPSVSNAFVRPTAADLRHMLSDTAHQSRREYPAFLGTCPCPVSDQLGLRATEKGNGPAR
jgi:hypothetical protein